MTTTEELNNEYLWGKMSLMDMNAIEGVKCQPFKTELGTAITLNKEKTFHLTAQRISHEGTQ